MEFCITETAVPCGLDARLRGTTSQSLRDSHSPSGTNVPPPPVGGVFPSRGAFGEEVGLCDMPKPLLLGEVAMRSIDGEVGQSDRCPRSQGPAVYATNTLRGQRKLARYAKQGLSL